MEVDRKLIEFATAWIEMQVAIKHGKYHDQPTIVEDIQELIDKGHMPQGYYKLKKALEESA